MVNPIPPLKKDLLTDHVGNKDSSSTKEKQSQSGCKRKMFNFMGLSSSEYYEPGPLMNTNIFFDFMGSHSSFQNQEPKSVINDAESDSSIDLELRLGPPLKRKITFTAAADDRHQEDSPCPWLIKKVLTKADIAYSGSHLITEDIVTRHFDHEIHAFETCVWDIDTRTQHSLYFTKWNISNVLSLGGNWTVEFVQRRGLKENDEIGLRWNDNIRRLEFKLIRRSKH